MNCPSCLQPLNLERHPNTPSGYVILWCAYKLCISRAADDGVSAPTEGEAYAALCDLVVEEEYRAAVGWDDESDESRRERIASQRADHENDLKGTL